MAEKTRNSVQSVMEEVSEGVPVVPASGSDFVPLQDGFSLSPSFSELENAELSGSIGKSKSTLGFEEPTASSDSYVKHSGVEGTAPQADLYYKAGLGATSTIAELSTSGTSTTTALKYADASTVIRGQAFLVKDATNGYSIRNATATHATDIPLNVALAVAPATATATGNPVVYLPGENHPSLTLWNYRGNGGAVEAIAGARISDLTVNIVAGEFINSSVSMTGTQYYFNPLTVTSSNKYIDVTDDGGTIVVTLTEATYKDPHELAAHIEAVAGAALLASGGDDFSCSYSDSTGKYTMATTTGTVLSFLWKTGTHGADNADDHVGSLIGYADAADDTASLSYLADTAIDLSSPYTPSFDTSNPLVAKSNEALFGDSTECLSTNTATFSLSNGLTNILDICSTSGKSGSIVGERTVTVELAGSYNRYDVDPFKRFREGTTTQFMYNAGVKSGGNWVAGSSVNFYTPEATVTSFELVDNDGLVDYNITLTAFVDSGKGEFYINFL